MGAALPVLKTKRFLYDVMITRLNKLDAYAARNNDAYEDSATAILGVRQIGKTVLLKQLYNAAPDISEYRDCTDLPSDFDFDGYLRELLDSGIKRLFLDEVCKIQRDSLADLIRFIKDACAFMSVTFTGSTKQAVASLSADVCRGRAIELPPIMYVERLAWARAKEVCYLTGEDLLGMSSIDAFASYLNTGTIEKDVFDISKVLGYVYGLVQDTMKSCFARYSSDKATELSNQDVNTILNYVSLVQHVIKTKKNAYCDLPILSRSIKNSIKDKWVAMQDILDITDKVTKMCHILLDSGLARKVSIYTPAEGAGFATKLESVPLIDENIPSLIFEYPWYASLSVTPELNKQETLWGIWLENDLLMKSVYCYPFADKYRRDETDELDMVYLTGLSVGNKKGGIESKWRPYSKVNNANDLARYAGIAKGLGLDELAITCKDKNWVVPPTLAEAKKEGYPEVIVCRADLLHLALELGYIDVQQRGDCYANKTALELMKHFGLDKIIG